MIHGQGIKEQPRKLLKNIPNLVIQEPIEAGVCCGSAGIYNIVQPKEAKQLGNIKSKNLQATNAELVASPNIGCSLQIRKYIKDDLRVAHPMEILAKSASLQNLP